MDLEKNFTVYRSSAGSGKTFTLVKEYLVLALSDPGPSPQAYRHILAVTFTNKAAAEMKDRIIRALKDLSEEDYSQLPPGSVTLLNILLEAPLLNQPVKITEKEIRRRAQSVLSSILHNYSDFAIGTIDSFVHKVVRTFAHDLKIPMQFDLEMDGEKLLQMAIDLLIAKIGDDEVLTKAMVAFAESKTDDEKSWHVERDLLVFAKNLLNEEGVLYIDKLKELKVADFILLRDRMLTYRTGVEEKLMQHAGKAIGLIKGQGLTVNDFYYGKSGIVPYFERIAEGDFEKIRPNSYVEKTVGEDCWPGAKVGRGETAAIDSIKGSLLDCFVQIQQVVDEHWSDYALFGIIIRNIYSLAVLNEIEQLLTTYKVENNILHISEFNQMISKIVLNEPIPFIYERLGEKYNNYLVDEFQDTSILQFQNLLPLIDNSLANGNFTMLVGDGKQAIYRWRGGEVEQFSMLPKIFSHHENAIVREREDSLVRNFGLKVLNKNFRSKREIIEFNNSFFRSLAAGLNPAYQVIYESLEQEFDPNKTGGAVSIEFIPEEKEALKEQNLAKTLSIIREVEKDGFRLQDIAILVRKNSDGSDIANYLSRNGIPVISSESLLLSNSRKVNFLCSMFSYLSNSADPIVQAEIIEFLVSESYIQDRALSALLEGHSEKKMATLLGGIIDGFSVQRLSKLALYELAEELIRLFGMHHTPDAYLQFFLDEVLQYSLKKNNNLNDFLEFWEDKKDKSSLIIPEGMNAVRIMTIHRSKGLEFPVVILPFANGSVKKGKDQLWIELEHPEIPELPVALVQASEEMRQTPYEQVYEKEKGKSLLDNLNVVYVALTRPEIRLYVLAGKPTANPDRLTNWSDFFAFYLHQQGLWKDNELVYTFGTPVPYKSKETIRSADFELPTFNSNQWRDSIKMRAAAPGIWNTAFSEVKKDHGVMMHAALARIHYSSDLEPALKAMMEEGLVDQQEMEALERSIAEILGHPRLQGYFATSWTVKNEAEIVYGANSLARPDRVLLAGKSAVVIDYKTGARKSAHKEQVLQYAELLRGMGYQVEQSLVVYVSPLEIDEF